MMVCRWFIWFVLYSMVGWLYESVLCSITGRKLVNRGFLNGPYCPIYGAGAVLDLLLLGWIDNPVLIFFAGMLVTGTVEYFTSWAMEKLFHAKWWDYSGWKFNLNGRICLAGLLVFGAMSVLMIKVVHPFVTRITDGLPDVAVIVLAAVLAVVMAADTVFTVVSFKDFNKKLQEIQAFIHENVANSAEFFSKTREQLLESELYARVSARLARFREKLNGQERRLMKAFPKWKSTRYNDALVKIRELGGRLWAKKADKSGETDESKED